MDFLRTIVVVSKGVILMRFILAAALMTYAAFAPVHAGFVSSYYDWRNLSPAGKEAYIGGIVDITVYVADFNNRSQMAFSGGLRSCIPELRLSNGMMAEAVDNYYAKNPQSWGDLPSIVFWKSVVVGVCRHQINRLRYESGLSPLPY